MTIRRNGGTQTISRPPRRAETISRATRSGCTENGAGAIIPQSTTYGVPGADDDKIFADILRSLERDRDDVCRALAHLATLSKEGNLKLEARLKRGRGYVVADRNADGDLPLGYIPVDSIHSPVRRVNYHVEGARVGGSIPSLCTNFRDQ